MPQHQMTLLVFIQIYLSFIFMLVVIYCVILTSYTGLISLEHLESIPITDNKN